MIVILRRKRLVALAMAVALCAASAAGIWVLAASATRLSGRLRIAVPPTLHDLAAGLVDEFVASNPSVDVVLVEEAEPAIPALVRGGVVDCGLIRHAGLGRGLTVTPVAVESAVPVVSMWNPVDSIPASSLVGLFSGRTRDWRKVAPVGDGAVTVGWARENTAAALLEEEVVRGRAEIRPDARFATTEAVRQWLAKTPGGISVLPASALGAGAKPLRLEGSATMSRPILAATPRRGGRRLPADRVRLAAAFVASTAARFLAPATTGAVVVLGGDLRLGISQAGADGVSSTDGAQPLSGVAQILRTADVCAANLEDPLSANGWRIGTRRAEPKAARVLADAGLDVLSLANDHSLDCDDPGLQETRTALKEAGLHAIGAGPVDSEARKPATMTVNGLRVVLLAYGDTSFCYSSTGRKWAASPYGGGIAPLEWEWIKADISAWRKMADLLIVSVHWGAEGAVRPGTDQRELARRIIDAGGDVVFGHHSHTLQGVEVYKRGLICYSLGDLLADPGGSGSPQGALLRVTGGGQGILAAEIVPLTFDKAGRPRVLTGAPRAAALRELADLSSRLDSASVDPPEIPRH